jgi:hypothetical protein
MNTDLHGLNGSRLCRHDLHDQFVQDIGAALIKFPVPETSAFHGLDLAKLQKTNFASFLIEQIP